MRAKTATEAPTREQPTKIAMTGLSIIAENAVPTQVIALVIHVVIASTSTSHPLSVFKNSLNTAVTVLDNLKINTGKIY